ncbi:MAG: ThuA domain-containing protein [Bryobacteraceae bacterium]|nr:ThuA domain-containing protein [Bryobacterales bacterium]MEB2360689.1 ThuA domain-containing protein [Bryobacterales bacterium]NUN04061.1 ThuA domain-containing protein [Bryobacteraceae bacterium]
MNRSLCVFLFLVLGAHAQPTSSVYSTANRPRALALIGDRYHSPVYIRDGLIQAFVRENIPVTFIEEVSQLSAASLGDYQLLVILRDGMNWPQGYGKPHVKWMTDEQQKAIWDFVERGGGFLALHNSQGLYPPGGLYYKLFGGDYGGHPEPYVFTIRVENRDHPVTAGIEDFEIFDEQHMVKYYLDREHLLLRSMARNNAAAAAGWWRELGQGRFVYLSPGHTPEALNHPMMQRLIRNSANWLLRLK